MLLAFIERALADRYLRTSTLSLPIAFAVFAGEALQQRPENPFLDLYSVSLQQRPDQSCYELPMYSQPVDSLKRPSSESYILLYFVIPYLFQSRAHPLLFINIHVETHRNTSSNSFEKSSYCL